MKDLQKERHILEVSLKQSSEKTQLVSVDLLHKEKRIKKLFSEIEDLTTQTRKQIKTIREQELEISKNDVSKKSSSRIKDEKIAGLEQLLVIEQESNKELNEKIQKSVITQIKASNNLLEFQNEHKQVSIDHHDLEVSHKALKKDFERKSKALNELNSAHNEALAEAENQEREIQTKKAIIEHIEALKDAQFEKHQKESERNQKKMEDQLNQNGMIFEDYRI